MSQRCKGNTALKTAAKIKPTGTSGAVGFFHAYKVGSLHGTNLSISTKSLCIADPHALFTISRKVLLDSGITKDTPFFSDLLLANSFQNLEFVATRNTDCF
jgi:hypothetical protein